MTKKKLQKAIIEVESTTIRGKIKEKYEVEGIVKDGKFFIGKDSYNNYELIGVKTKNDWFIHNKDF